MKTKTVKNKKFKLMLKRARATDAYKLEYTILALEHILDACKDALKRGQTTAPLNSSSDSLKSK